jgi:hypothetical protein
MYKVTKTQHKKFKRQAYKKNIFHKHEANDLKKKKPIEQIIAIARNNKKMVCNTTNGNGNLQDVMQLLKRLERSGTMLIRA